MKLIKYIGHPVLVMSLYLLLIIEGEHFGGFYLLYLFMSLYVGASYALVAVTGLLIVFIGYKIYRKNLHPIKPICYLSGYALMILSLIIFFERKERLETFEVIIPMLSFILFALVSILFLVNTFLMLRKSIQHSDGSFKVIA